MERNPKLFQYLGYEMDNKFLRFMNSLDSQITRNLNEANIETRPVKSNGLWCCAILPAVLITYNILYKVSPVYSLVAYISLGLLFYSLLFIVFMSISCLILNESIFGSCLASSIVSALLLYTFLGKGLTFSLLFSLPTVYVFTMLLRMSITRFPKTFSIGEAMLVVQSVVLFGVMVVGMMFLDGGFDEEMNLIYAVVNTVLSTVGLIVTAICVMKDDQRNLQNLRYIFIGASAYAVILLHALLGIRAVLKVLEYVFRNGARVQLFTFWLGLVLIAILFLLVRTKLAVKASTVTRKTFHILASAVFLSGILNDERLMTLAAGVGLGLLVLVEALRKSRIEPISSALQSVFLVYCDEKDCGSFAMTPLYLYCGLACPLLLTPRHAGARPELLSGVLATGVGDTAASWFGSRYGFNKWAGGNKSVEGTAFNILCQISTIYALQLFDLLGARNALIRTAVAATASGLVEARTEQVDNLVLPLVTMLAFQLTWPLC